MKNELSNKNIGALLDPQGLLKRVLSVALKAVQGQRGSLMLLNPNTGSLDIEASVGLNLKARRIKVRVGEGVTGWVASTGKVLRLNDVKKDRRYIPIDQRVQSEIAVPINLKGQVVGILNIDSDQKNAFSEHHEQVLLHLADDASEWISLAWEINQLRLKGDQLGALVDMGQVIVSEDEQSGVLERITREACQLMKARISSLMLLDETGEELILKAWHGASAAYIKKPNLRIDESLVGVVVNRLKPLAVLNVQENQRFQHTELARREHLVSLLAVPLIFQGKALGVLCVYTEDMHRFSNEEIRLLSAMAGLSSVAIAKAQLLQRVVQVEESLKATERLSALGWLAAEIAHEIRNPLTVVQMVFHSMMQELKLEGGHARDAALIEMKMQHMNKILDQVLTFARSSEPEMEDLDVASMLDDILILTRHKLAEQRVEIKKLISEEAVVMKGDRAQLEQAVLNLVLNACQAMPHGGTLTLSAALRVGVKKREVVISIRDTGEGMSKRRQDELFQPFLTYRKGGTGLGLALVNKTVQSHHGKITVHSKLKKGTSFTLRFPAPAL
jgi:signal transduction histidine kinase